MPQAVPGKWEAELKDHDIKPRKGSVADIRAQNQGRLGSTVSVLGY
jgi:hypothetical protein